MRLLFDQNLPPKLTESLSDLYPGSTHVRHVGLDSGSDEEVWDFAAKENYTIVSKDSDFHQRSFVLGHPPKVVWIRKGNCSTEAIEKLLRTHHQDLVAFSNEEGASFLALA